MVKQTKLVPAARPFLKWAGGKTQLLEEFSKRLPAELKGKKITKYVEPFIGGGAYFYLTGTLLSPSATSAMSMRN